MLPTRQRYAPPVVIKWPSRVPNWPLFNLASSRQLFTKWPICLVWCEELGDGGAGRTTYKVELPYGLLAEQKINHVIKTYFRVSVYPLGSGSVGAETETREKIWAQRRKNHRSLAWDILPLCPGIYLLCGVHCPFIHLRSTTWTRATWTGSRSMSTTLQRSSAQPWPTHPPWPPRPTPATQVDLKTLFHFTSSNHMFSLF